jgi:hypothetical protein
MMSYDDCFVLSLCWLAILVVSRPFRRLYLRLAKVHVLSDDSLVLSLCWLAILVVSRLFRLLYLRLIYAHFWQKLKEVLK